MKKNIKTDFLKPGMVFSEPVYINEDYILVPAGIPIRQKDIDNLLDWGITSVGTDGVQVSGGKKNTDKESADPFGLSSEDGEEDALVEDTSSSLQLSDVQENKGAYRAYMSLIERINISLLRIATRHNNMDNRPISMMSAELLKEVRDRRDRLIGFILGGEVKGHEMAKSAVNVAILSALIAQEIRLPNHKVMSTVIAALLHDTGMLRLPKEVINKKGELSEAEQQLVQSHPLLTHKIVTRELNYSDEVGNIVLQHHERWNGDGYPHRIAGNKIDIGARIVSIADAFEAMVSKKPYRNPLVGYQAMKNLLADNSRRFDPNVLKAFILTMGIYPIGSIVQLNNGAITRVAEARANAPLRPKVQVLIDENKNEFKGEKGGFIDLLVDKNLYITKAMTAKEISELNA